MSGESSLNYIREDYDISPDDSFPTLGLGFKYEQKFFDQKLVYFNNFNLDKNLQDRSDVLIRNRMGIRVPIASGINLSTVQPRLRQRTGSRQKENRYRIDLQHGLRVLTNAHPMLVVQASRNVCKGGWFNT